MSDNILEKIEEVEIAEGVFKYIQISISLPNFKAEKIIIRGADLEYHDDIFQAAKGSITDTIEFPEMPVFNCIGGGRISHDVVNKKILVYGYSVAYGRANHELAVEYLKNRYPDYNSISFSNSGY